MSELMTMDERVEANRKHWDEAVPIHVASTTYDVANFGKGRGRLKPVELEEVGDVRGKSLLHLQCHFGLDTLSWAMEGARVTGADFSEPAIEAARKLAEEHGIDARFVVSDIYDLPERLDGNFDIVFTSYGALNWLPDVERWAGVAWHFVKPGGTFYIVEFHPVAMIFDDDPDVTELKVRYPYFPEFGPIRSEDDGTYAELDAKFENKVTYDFPHPTSEVVTALIDAGFQIEFFHEFPFGNWKFLPIMEHIDRYTCRLIKNHGSVPLLYSIKATRAV